VPAVASTSPKGKLRGLPYLPACRVRRKHRPPDVVHPYIVNHAALNHRHRHPVHPDVFPQQGVVSSVYLLSISITTMDEMSSSIEENICN